jgi:Flp pilus assembly protein TadB
MRIAIKSSAWSMLFLFILALGACAEASRMTDDHASRGAPAAARDIATQSTALKAAEEPASPAAEAAPKLIIKEATIKIRTASPRSVIDASNGLAQRYGGFVVKSETAAVEQSAIQANVTLRVRAERLDAALAELRTLGEVLSESVSGEDVTAEFIDVQARTKAKQVLEQRLLAIAATAAKVEDMLKVETELSRVRSEIEQLEGRSKYLQDRARLSLIHVTAVSPSQAYEPGAESFGSKMRGAFGRARDVSVAIAVALVVVAGFFLPLAVVGLVALVPVGIWWRRKRRRALAATEPPKAGT